MFIDDYSRFTWVYFAKEKYEALPIFKKFKSCVEKQSGQSLKIPRTDQDGEFFHMNSIILCRFWNFEAINSKLHSTTKQCSGEKESKSCVDGKRFVIDHQYY